MRSMMNLLNATGGADWGWSRGSLREIYAATQCSLAEYAMGLQFRGGEAGDGTEESGEKESGYHHEHPWWGCLEGGRIGGAEEQVQEGGGV